jgi:hypothetical protein
MSALQNLIRIIFLICSAPPADHLVRSFLITGERRVILHRKKPLDDPSLLTEERRRLMRLVSEAEAWFEGLLRKLQCKINQ